MSMNLNKIDFTDAIDFDIRDLTHASDSVKVGDGTDFLEVNADGSINITDNGGSLTVDATDLDIRDLTAASDSVQSHLFDGAGTALTSTLVGADQSLDVNLTQSVTLTVQATQLDIDDLNATDDAVSAWTKDGSGNAITSSAGALDVNIQSSDISIDVEEEANTAIENTPYTATTVGADVLGGSQLADRKYIFVQNLGSADVFVGKPGVTTANGLKLFKNNTLEARIGPALALHALTASSTADVRVMELA